MSASRRLVFRAVVLVAPLVLGSLAAPVIVRGLRGGAPAGPLQEVVRDRQPTSEEILEALRTERELARMEERTWGQADFVAPQEPRPDASGEITSRFKGFGISVESQPSGAHVLVNGEDLGETPLVTSVSCEPGVRVIVRLIKSPLLLAERVTTCRDDTLVALSAKLRQRRPRQGGHPVDAAAR